MTDQTLRISEIFYSLQGEAKTVGLPTAFVRLTGCPLRCIYCDTEYAFHGGSIMSVESIIEQVKAYGAHYVTITGGEPLAQKNCVTLINKLCDLGYEVSLETSGTMPVAGLHDSLSIVMDLKTPKSGELAQNDYSNIHHLRKKDQIKFVLADRADYEWAKFKLDEYHLLDQVGEVLFSPVHDELPPTQLADWILADKLLVRLQLQLHKLLWQDGPGR